MKFTNMFNLPEPLFKAVCNDPYNAKSDFTVTGLLKPARQSALEYKHKDELSEDAADRIWALMGQIGHLVLERAGMKSGEYVEKRHTILRTIAGETYSVSGQVDLWESQRGHNSGELALFSTLMDYKFTSIWAVKDGLKPEWEQQCNLNALLCRENKIRVDRAEIVAIFRDWSVGEARRSKDYPKEQVRVLEVPLWTPDRQENFLLERMASHLAARQGDIYCSPIERWARPEKWAVMKPGRDRALKLYDSKSEAAARANDGTGSYVEHRPAVQTRCLDYCSVSKWCEQFKQLDPAGWQAMQTQDQP